MLNLTFATDVVVRDGAAPETRGGDDRLWAAGNAETAKDCSGAGVVVVVVVRVGAPRGDDGRAGIALADDALHTGTVEGRAGARV